MSNIAKTPVWIIVLKDHTFTLNIFSLQNYLQPGSEYLRGSQTLSPLLRLYLCNKMEYMQAPSWIVWITLMVTLNN